MAPLTASKSSPLTRGLRLLELYSTAEGELTISEMARRSGIPKSTTHRLVGELVAWGALERGKGGMRLGGRLFELGHLVPLHRTLREIAGPYAHNLNQFTHLTSNLAVRDGHEIVYVEKVATQLLRVNNSRAGGRMPLHCTALGKAILAYSGPTLVDQVLSGPLSRFSRHTITDPDAVRSELQVVRETKVAYDVEESQDGLFCVAAPLFATQNRIIGAISVTGATKVVQAQRFAPTVRSTAAALSRALQGTGYGASVA
jgi:IclR family acetate operon transcriptional repressor